MPSKPNPTTAPGESAMEWDRLRQFANAPGAPLALIEVESSAQADDVVAALTRLHGGQGVQVYRLNPGTDPGASLEWVAQQAQKADQQTLLLILGLEDLPTDEESARPFWTWANAQRERWKPGVGKLAFVLTPSQVNHLARFADALWDWIPLKFNLLRLSPVTGQRRDQERMLTRAGGSHRTPASAEQVLPALRQQLLRAREQGLSEGIVRRENAWPLLQALCDAHHISEAAALLETDLGGDFASELRPDERDDWWQTVAYLHLDLWDLPKAEQAFRALGEYGEQQDDQLAIGPAWFGLARTLEQARDFAGADEWYRKALGVAEKQGDEHGAAITYHQLGVIAQDQGDFAGAEEWYRKSLVITENQGDEHSAAATYHARGIIAQKRRDFAAAEEWYRKSLAIEEKLGDEHGAAVTYHQLGVIAQEQRDLAGAEEWHRKSLAIEEKLGDEHGAAMSYHELGIITAEQRNFGVAEEWYRKCLAIEEKQRNKHGAAGTYGQLGILAGLREHWEASGQWLVKSLQVFVHCNDEHEVQRTAENFMATYKKAPRDVQAKLETMWCEAGLGELPSTDAEDDRS